MERVKEWSNGDEFYVAKATKMYNGTFLSPNVVKRSILRIMRGFAMLEAALKADGGNKKTYLINEKFSQADIAVYPRLCKAPQNGILSTSGQRSLFPNVLRLFSGLAKRPAFKSFWWRDLVIWSSGVYPRFAQELGWWGWLLPWWAIIQVGNYKSGVKFKRFTLSDFSKEVVSGSIPNWLRSEVTAILAQISPKCSNRSKNPLLTGHSPSPKGSRRWMKLSCTMPQNFPCPPLCKCAYRR